MLYFLSELVSQILPIQVQVGSVGVSARWLWHFKNFSPLYILKCLLNWNWFDKSSSSEEVGSVLMSARGGAAVKTEICHCCARGKPETTLEKVKVGKFYVKK